MSDQAIDSESPRQRNWRDAMETVAGMNKEKLIRQLLQQIEKMRPKRGYKRPLWSIVGEATSHGSTVASAILATYYPEGDQ